MCRRSLGCLLKQVFSASSPNKLKYREGRYGDLLEALKFKCLIVLYPECVTVLIRSCPKIYCIIELVLVYWNSYLRERLQADFIEHFLRLSMNNM